LIFAENASSMRQMPYGVFPGSGGRSRFSCKSIGDQENTDLSEDIWEEPDNPVFTGENLSLYSEMSGAAIVDKIGNAQEVQIGSCIPLIRQ